MARASQQESKSNPTSTSATSHQPYRRYNVPSPPTNQQVAPPNDPSTVLEASSSQRKHRKHRHRRDGEGRADKRTAASKMVLPDIYERRRVVPYLNIYNMREEQQDEDIQQQHPLTDRAIYDRADQQKIRRSNKKRLVAQSVDYTSLRNNFSVDASIRNEQPIPEEFVMTSIPITVNSEDVIQKQMYQAQRKRKERKTGKKKVTKSAPPIIEEVEEEQEPMKINRMFVKGVFGVH